MANLKSANVKMSISMYKCQNISNVNVRIPNPMSNVNTSKGAMSDLRVSNVLMSKF